MVSSGLARTSTAATVGGLASQTLPGPLRPGKLRLIALTVTCDASVDEPGPLAGTAVMHKLAAEIYLEQVNRRGGWLGWLGLGRGDEAAPGAGAPPATERRQSVRERQLAEIGAFLSYHQLEVNSQTLAVASSYLSGSDPQVVRLIDRRVQAREPVTPRVLLDAIAPLVSLQARKLGVQVRTVLEPDLPPVLCDRTMVEQVLLNLARNGMQAMDHPACRARVLTLRVGKAASNAQQGWLEFSVTDVGSGIDAAVAEQLFTPFFTTKAEGMGLGLSLCRTVIEQHGGYLDHAPNRPSGTVFRFTLPIARAAASA